MPSVAMYNLRSFLILGLVLPLVLPLILTLCSSRVAANDSDSKVLSLAEVLAQADKLEGRLITIMGTVRVGRLIKNADGSSRFQGAACTRMACAPANPCCNSCHSGASLVDGMDGTALTGNWQGEAVGCHGNECEMQCNPESDTEHTFTGRLEHDASTGELMLRIED
ncbi:MAG: hypothetical protein KDK30_18385 [Leptospiraceae bacterium]|nr:hypothetical protein [Leptospiraceae bacterium]